jgi:hypothetical protein
MTVSQFIYFLSLPSSYTHLAFNLLITLLTIMIMLFSERHIFHLKYFQGLLEAA